MTSSFVLLFLLNQSIGSYLIMKIMDLLLGNSVKTSKKYILVVVHMIVNTMVYFYFESPIIQFVSTILTLLLISTAYEVNISLRINTVMIIIAFLFISEYTGYLSLGIAENVWSHGIIKNTIFLTFLNTSIKCFLVYVLYRSKLKRLQEVDERLRFYFISMPFITLIILVFIITLVEGQPIIKFYLSFSILVLMLYILYSYRRSYSVMTEKFELELLEKQNELYKKELENINLQNERTMILRHDFKNIVYKIRELAYQKDYREIDKIISKYYIDHFEKDYINTGNIDFDSILNYKIGSMEKQSIECNLDILIPPYKFMESYDLMILIGNILDNAIEANLKLKEDRWIKGSILTSRGVLNIEISNPTDRKSGILGNSITKSTKNSIEHGYGLKSVREIIEMYDGNMYVNYEGEVFTVIIKILLKEYPD